MENTLSKLKDNSPGLFHCFCRQPYIFFIYLKARSNAGAKGNGIDWRERRLISKMYVERVKLKLDREETRRVKNGRGVIQ